MTRNLKHFRKCKPVGVNKYRDYGLETVPSEVPSWVGEGASDRVSDIVLHLTIALSANHNTRNWLRMGFMFEEQEMFDD